MLAYVQMELARGVLPSGKRYIGEDALLARRTPQVNMDAGTDYGMGLMLSREWGVTIVHHDGDLGGYHSDVMWLPDHQVGAVILTTSDVGALVRDELPRRLLELLFDGTPIADAQLRHEITAMHEGIARERNGLTIPAAEAVAAKLAPRYSNPALGTLVVKRGAGVTFVVEDWRSEVGTRTTRDGRPAFVTLGPGLGSFVFEVGEQGGKRALLLRDLRGHSYVFVEN
jgi:hypothetical protein